jgi:hypothetical protein
MVTTIRELTPGEDDGEFDDEIEFWLCPYLARHESWPGHDPLAVCAFGCWDEPACVTGGPWTDDQIAGAIQACQAVTEAQP